MSFNYGYSDPRGQLNALTIGGNTVDFKTLPLTTGHFEQRDTTLNEALWDRIPTDLDYQGIVNAVSIMALEQERCLRRYFVSRPGLGNYMHLPKLVPQYESIMACGDLHNLFIIQDLLHQSGIRHPSLDITLSARRKRGAVLPVSEVVQRMTAGKERGNKSFKAGKYLDALDAYYLAILNIYPWTNTPCLFSATEAFQYGVAQLHGAIWSNIATTLKKHADTTTDKIWFTLSVNVAGQLCSHRFISRRILAKAFKHCTLDPENSVLCQFSNLDDTRASEASHIERLYKLISASDKKHGGNGSDWAHEDCIMDHDGCGCSAEEVMALFAKESAGLQR